MSWSFWWCEQQACPWKQARCRIHPCCCPSYIYTYINFIIKNIQSTNQFYEKLKVITYVRSPVLMYSYELMTAKWVPTSCGAWNRESTIPLPLVMSCWSSDISYARPLHLSLSVCWVSSISLSAAKILNDANLLLLTACLEFTIFFKLLPKKVELGTAATPLLPFKLNCHHHNNHRF